ncbi:acetyltransferase [Allochromatium palmeri]|uniref:Acetyltransferase n=1 Tax=Allochromatium palmeri TaxID=231048 RepID=A0A6N8E832_9GAMM|nr:acetyltransferase [Allochromatium palmeri]MTW20442.1 acetyltransferase [Allochromatium palmeri]
MIYYDVFNGDADGLCALHQLRLIEPRDSQLITGPKREIDLLGRVPLDGVAGVTVLDISMEKNAAALERLLESGVQVSYFDHHFPGEIPNHPGLQAHLDTRPDVCTSLLVDAYLEGRARAWAVVGAFGDNLDHSARRAAESLNLDPSTLDDLRELGICLNYNGYGPSIEDLHFAPDDLYRRLQPYADPRDFIAGDAACARLRDGYADDMARARALVAEYDDARHRLFILPAEPWARRASGVYANELAQQAPEKAHAILTCLSTGGFLVSVRAPLSRLEGADTLCRQFATGGGRKGAAGINQLPEADYDRFLDAFRAAWA